MEERIESGLAFKTNAWPLDPRKPTLVFIHGAGNSNVLWNSLLRGLDDRRNLLALDLPGHGRSPGTGYAALPDYARVVMDFLIRVEVPGPIPVGLSMGGAITQQLLLDYPDNFLAGVLIGTGARMKVMPVIFETIETELPGLRRISQTVRDFPENRPGAYPAHSGRQPEMPAIRGLR